MAGMVGLAAIKPFLNVHDLGVGDFGPIGLRYPLVNFHITMERSIIFHGNIHYFNGDVQ